MPVAEKAMKEEPNKLWTAYKNLSIEWDKFKELLRGIQQSPAHHQPQVPLYS